MELTHELADRFLSGEAEVRPPGPVAPRRRLPPTLGAPLTPSPAQPSRDLPESSRTAERRGRQ